MTKLEEVARAIARVHYARKEFSGWCTLDARLNYLVNKYWDQFVPDAKAAIAAMCEPSEVMIDAGEMALHESGPSVDLSITARPDAAVTYRAMIDVALTD